jgi:hypothetical protein
VKSFKTNNTFRFHVLICINRYLQIVCSQRSHFRILNRIDKEMIRLHKSNLIAIFICVLIRYCNARTYHNNHNVKIFNENDVMLENRKPGESTLASH